jgi:NAD(P)H-flavin reductase/ferredoxin
MSVTVTVLPFEHAVECRDDESILAAALRQGLFLRYGCRHGGCGTCKAVLVDGEVTGEGSSFALSSAERAEGIVLLCCSRPVTDCMIDVQSMELTEDEFLAGDRVGVFETEVAGLDALTQDIWDLRLALREPPTMAFGAGQFVNVQLPGSQQIRSYSIANPPQQDDRIELIVKVLPGGAFSTLVTSGLALCDPLRLFGPLGELKLRLSHRKVLMVAGGSGLAPFLSMLRHLECRGRTREIDLVFGARRVADLYHLDELQRLTAALPGVTFIPALSQPGDDTWPGARGLVTEVIAERYPSLDGYDAYLAGPPPMIEATIPLLTGRGVRPSNIRFDAFVPSIL